MTVLALRGVTRWYPGSPRPVLQDLDLVVQEHETMGVLGASGAGKSTLVRILAGLDTPQGGVVERGADPRRPTLVPQSPDLFPWLTVAENIALGGRFAANREHFRAARVAELLDDLGIAELAEALPAELSGGQAQRVALGRALAVDPAVVLLDEPFSALDPAIRSDLQVWLREVLTRLRITAVLVTHDVDEALTVADHVVYLDGARGITARWRPREDGTGRDEVLAHYRARPAEASS
ncbi:ABC transporter ATP-binding protein [Brachybacterium squillarum]|uniref:ABC transporter ATP-binding protein n=1 Tax=Brachybacterium squillarum TaxID=661979 RepID=UPI00222381E9|nr:ATP-binding cassette domain-containing protein [Brachybacterium squillarum]MCW1805384.1 ATP-binding cassette domain-containing protein [Brachybacterium squillarum]